MKTVNSRRSRGTFTATVMLVSSRSGSATKSGVTRDSHASRRYDKTTLSAHHQTRLVHRVAGGRSQQNPVSDPLGHLCHGPATLSGLGMGSYLFTIITTRNIVNVRMRQLPQTPSSRGRGAQHRAQSTAPNVARRGSRCDRVVAPTPLGVRVRGVAHVAGHVPCHANRFPCTCRANWAGEILPFVQLVTKKRLTPTQCVTSFASGLTGRETALYSIRNVYVYCNRNSSGNHLCICKPSSSSARS
jgi:hypothetical protein